MFEPQKILLLRLSAIGDIVLTSPLVRALRRRFPNARIDFVIKKNFAELMAHNPHLNAVHCVEPELGFKGLAQLGRQLRRARYDLVLDLHRNFRTIFLTRLCRATRDAPQVAHYRKHILRRWFFVKFKAATMQHIPPVAQRYLQTAAFLDLPGDDARTELYWQAEHEEEARRVLLQAEQPLICLAPGAGYFTKRWPVAYFAEIAREFAAAYKNCAVAILGGKQDRELGQYIREHSRVELLDLTGACSLLASAAIIKRSRLVLANDSGLMHIAEAVGTPVLALFGSTTRELGFFPQRATSRVLEQLNVECRPCSHLGFHACPAGHFRCMNEITPQRVLEEMKQAVASSK